jgi:hypothetical protein
VDPAQAKGTYSARRSGIITVMQNTRLPWLLSLPLMAAGCLGAHSAAYRLIEHSAAEPAHGYLGLAPLLLAIGVALGVVAALRSVLAGHRPAGAPTYLFALLPPLAFTLQEHLERALQGGGALQTALEPAFLLGLVLQLPFAVCALVVARSLFRVAEATGALLSFRVPRPLRPPILRRPAFTVDAPRLPALASPQTGRAPPLPA